MYKMRNTLYILFFTLTASGAVAQQGEETFSFMRYPTSARVNALGGNNISLVERDPSLVFHNPALLGGEMDGMLNLNYMNFFSDIHTGSALFTKARGEKGAWGAGATFISYGSFKQTTVENLTEGAFSVEDISLNAFYSHDLSARWRGGLSFKFLYSSIERYTSIGLAVDAGLSYYNSEKELALAFVLKNAGAQLKAYYEKRYPLPWDIQAGLSKRLAHAPFRLSLTSMYLNKWDISFIEHFVAGIDFIPSENFWLGIGYNPKTARDLKLESGNGLGGFSAGGGIKIKTFDVGVSVARYHPSALSLLVSLSTTLP
jgi:hypothetical protein